MKLLADGMQVPPLVQGREAQGLTITPDINQSFVFAGLMYSALSLSPPLAGVGTTGAPPEPEPGTQPTGPAPGPEYPGGQKHRTMPDTEIQSISH